MIGRCRLYYPKAHNKLSRTDRSWLNLAARVAQTSTERYKHGAVLVRGGRLLATATNRRTLDPYYYVGVADVFSIHAEDAVMRRVGNPRGAVLYVARVNNAGDERMSQPCEGCQVLIDNFGIKRCVWTVDTQYLDAVA